MEIRSALNSLAPKASAELVQCSVKTLHIEVCSESESKVSTSKTSTTQPDDEICSKMDAKRKSRREKEEEGRMCKQWRVFAAGVKLGISTEVKAKHSQNTQYHRCQFSC